MIIRRSPSWQSTSHTDSIQKSVLLANGEVPTITQFATSVFSAGSSVEAHVHEDMYESFYVQSGKIWVEVDGEVQEFEKGDAFTILPKEVHAMGNSTFEEAVVTYFGVLI